MAKVKVPFDVLAEVMARADPRVIAAMMETCHALYSQGPRHILRHGVVLRDARDLTSFTSFMLSRADTSRFAHFRKLDLATGHLADPYCKWARCAAIDEFLQILQTPALCLETLILQMVDELQDYNSALFAVLASLTTVKHLVLMNGPSHASAMLSASLSRLSSVTVAGGYIDLDALERFSGTLESVTCETFDVNQGTLSFYISLECPTDVRVRRSVSTRAQVGHHLPRRQLSSPIQPALHFVHLPATRIPRVHTTVRSAT